MLGLLHTLTILLFCLFFFSQMIHMSFDLQLLIVLVVSSFFSYVQKDKRSTKHTYKTKDRVTRTPLKTGGELRCSGRVSSSCSTSGTPFYNTVHTWNINCMLTLYIKYKTVVVVKGVQLTNTPSKYIWNQLFFNNLEYKSTYSLYFKCVPYCRMVCQYRYRL
jgi:hypothetical protein